jgi:hypothetical protein
MRLTVSRELHYLWEKHATFVIVPSQATREKMIQILRDDRTRVQLAADKNEMISPCRLAVSPKCPGDIEYSLYRSQYPEVVTYDIILFQPSLFGSFHRADNDEDEPTYYITPKQSSNPAIRLEYLKKLDDATQVREVQNIQHIKGRSEIQAVNPYLGAMNAREKLRYWEHRLPIGSDADPVFHEALCDCQRIMKLISKMPGANILMSKSKLSFTAVLQRLIDVLS